MKRRHRDTRDVDEYGIVRPGGRVRVPVTMMDSMDAIQRQVASDFVADRPRVRAFDGTNAGLHRPGARFAAGVDPLVLRGVARDRAEIYRLYDATKSEEWRAPPTGSDSGDLRGRRAGDLCTIDGRAGRLQNVNRELVCVPDQHADAFPRRKLKRNRFGQEEGEEEYERGGGVLCPTCHGSGTVGWVHENADEDDDDNDEIEQAVRRASTHHESTQRRDDHMTIDELREHHADIMRRIYEGADTELAQQWRHEK